MHGRVVGQSSGFVNHVGMEAIPMRPGRIACYTIASIFAIAGASSWFVSSQAVEESDGVYFTVGSSTVRLPDNGMLGDFGTYCAEWQMLGLFCFCSAFGLFRLPTSETKGGQYF